MNHSAHYQLAGGLDLCPSTSNDRTPATLVAVKLRIKKKNTCLNITTGWYCRGLTEKKEFINLNERIYTN